MALALLAGVALDAGAGAAARRWSDRPGTPLGRPGGGHPVTALIESVETPLDQPPVIGSGPEAAAPRRPPRFPAFDGLRAIAAVTVVVVHVAFVSGLTPKNPAGVGMYTARLEIGVSVFFLISGFLLYRPFVVAHLAGAPKPRTGAFWLRRLLRIVPAYWLVLFVTTSIFRTGPGDRAGRMEGLRIALPLPADLLPLPGPEGDLRGLVPLRGDDLLPLHPPLRRPARPTPGPPHRPADPPPRAGRPGRPGGRSASPGAFTVLQFQSHHSPYFRLATVWLPAYLDLFALGMGLAVVSAWMHHRDHEPGWLGSRWFPWVAWACALACFWGVSHIGSPVIPVYFESDLDLARQTLYSLFAFFLLLPAVFGPQGRGLIRRFLQWWPMASLGVISYGIYLWHETWIYQILGQGHYHDFNLEFWAFFLAVLGLSIISASLSYFIVEKPALRLKNSLDWWRRTTGGPDHGPAATAPRSEQPVASGAGAAPAPASTSDTGTDGDAASDRGADAGLPAV